MVASNDWCEVEEQKQVIWLPFIHWRNWRLYKRE